jgi:dinuclear metal center YbgI/SA1388 family protein
MMIAIGKNPLFCLKFYKMKLKELCKSLEQWAPLAYQESYDNSGLIVGDESQEISGVLVSLDCVENVVDEAISKGCNVIVSHHPIVFKGLKSFTGKNYVERTVIKAIKNDIALYAIHTNLDNVHTGVNKMLADKIGLINYKVLVPKKELIKQLITYVPKEKAVELREALFSVGAGSFGEYSDCSFSVSGMGTFKGSEKSNPVYGEKGIREEVEEERIEIIFPSYLESKLISTLKNNHPYEEVAYSVISIVNENQNVGSGMIGELSQAQNSLKFLQSLKIKLNAKGIRHTSLVEKNIKKVAICGGAGSFLLQAAIRSNADVFITGDFKYHEFFDAEEDIIIADVGHYESEQYTKDLIADFLSEKFPKFAVHLSEVNTNPINYL